MRNLLLCLVAGLAACGGSGDPGRTGSPAPSAGTTPVYDIQGAGAASPLVGRAVTAEGVVTGDFQDNDADTARNLGGFYMQGNPDGDAATSDAVFVFDGNNPPTDVDVGDVVRVTGTVAEFFGETQIDADTVSIVGSGSIQAAPFNLPAPSTTSNSDGETIADLESLEGTLVRFPQTLTVSQLRNLERFGEVVLSQGGRAYAYTNRNAPDGGGFAAHRAALAARRIVLDDGRRDEFPDVSPPPLRNGDEVTNLTGVLRYSRGSGGAGSETWRLMPTADPAFVAANPRPPAPGVGGALRVASFNLNNWFSTVDSGPDVCGPASDQGCRGADSAAERSRQLAKFVTALAMIDAGIVGLIEIENDAVASLQALVDALNAALGAGTYAYVDTGTIGDDAIKVGLIYQPSAVQPAGSFEILDRSVDNRFNDNRNRPVLAQSFQVAGGTAAFTIAVNHLKSKGSGCDADGDPNLGDGQGNCSATRTAAAHALFDWLSNDPTSSGDSDVLIVGDFNAHTLDDAMTVFANGGYTNIATTLLGTDAYSFEFDAQSGSLDHALASPSLTPQVVDALDWHINADEAPWHDYNLESGRDPALFDAATPYRSSDHDPLIIGLDLVP